MRQVFAETLRNSRAEKGFSQQPLTAEAVETRRARPRINISRGGGADD